MDHLPLMHVHPCLHSVLTWIDSKIKNQDDSITVGLNFVTYIEYPIDDCRCYWISAWKILQPRFLCRHSLQRNADPDIEFTHSDMRGGDTCANQWFCRNNRRCRKRVSLLERCEFFRHLKATSKDSFSLFFEIYWREPQTHYFNLMKYHTASSNGVLTHVYIYTHSCIYNVCSTYIISFVSDAFISDVLELPGSPFFFLRVFCGLRLDGDMLYWRIDSMARYVTGIPGRKNHKDLQKFPGHPQQHPSWKGSNALAQVAVCFWKWHQKTKVD